MKKAFIFFSGVLLLVTPNYYSFSQTPAKKTVTKTTKTVSKKTSTGAANTTLSKEDVAQGQELISKSDCLSCHQPKMKVVGPAYNAVAAKYPATEANISKLSQKIIKGGAGTWGQVPMTPHPQIAEADAQKMVKYVLSLKGK
jgi:cytochrome c